MISKQERMLHGYVLFAIIFVVGVLLLMAANIDFGEGEQGNCPASQTVFS